MDAWHITASHAPLGGAWQLTHQLDALACQFLPLRPCACHGMGRGPTHVNSFYACSSLRVALTSGRSRSMSGEKLGCRTCVLFTLFKRASCGGHPHACFLQGAAPMQGPPSCVLRAGTISMQATSMYALCGACPHAGHLHACFVQKPIPCRPLPMHVSGRGHLHAGLPSAGGRNCS